MVCSDNKQSSIIFEAMQISSKRRFNKIQYCNETRQLNISKKKGNEQQTASLNINLKTINKNYLNEFVDKNPNEQAQAIINDYINKEKGNFKSTKKLFGADSSEPCQDSHEEIRKYMVQNYSNTGFIKRIFSNEKMDFKSKLIFIKFLEKIRLSALAPNEHNFWKERL